MTESERMQIKGALRKCAKENEGKTTYTGHVVISSVCNAAADRIEELEKENTELKDNFKIAKDNEYKYQGLFTIAKEIIKRLLCVVRNHLCIADISFNVLINDAEKILKEE